MIPIEGCSPALFFEQLDSGEFIGAGLWHLVDEFRLLEFRSLDELLVGASRHEFPNEPIAIEQQRLAALRSRRTFHPTPGA